MRNSFLAGAFELRSGMPTGASPKTTGPDVIRGMTTGLWLDFLGVRLESEKVEGHSFILNLVTPDNGEKYVVELSNANAHQHPAPAGEESDADHHREPRRSREVMMGKTTFDDLIAGGEGEAGR